MALKERQQLMERLESARGGRRCIAFINFDREAQPPVPGIATIFESGSKEPLFRVLKETPKGSGLDLFIYTRGGSVDAVWPVVSLIREFDPDFHVLVPFACHSAGTMLALGAKRIVLTPMAELSPIDPTCGNQFNPVDEATRTERLGISVEDVTAYREFILKQFQFGADDASTECRSLSAAFLQQLTNRVHPLALGNVHRVYQQGRRLADQLIRLHELEDALNPDEVVKKLSSDFFSHLHAINRHEAKEILKSRIELADAEVSAAMDGLLHTYEDNFDLRRKFIANEQFRSDNEVEVRLIGGAIESAAFSYLYETKLRLRRHPAVPPNIQLHLQANDDISTIRGLPIQIVIEAMSEAWIHNKEPLGVTK